MQTNNDHFARCSLAPFALALIAHRYIRHASVKTLERHCDMLGFEDAKRNINKLPGFGNTR